MVNVDAVLLKVLKQLQQEVSEGHYPETGICSYVGMNVGGFLGDVYNRMREIMHQWPLATGSKAFPVPACEGDNDFSSALQAYQSYAELKLLWSGSEHAELRKQLLNWMVDQLEKNQNEDS